MKKLPKGMSLAEAAKHVEAAGRMGDTQLVHLNPIEVQGIASLSPVGLTTNPDTGLQEAFLPLLFSVAAPALFGSTALATTLGGSAGLAALGSGLGTIAEGGSLEDGIMAGLTGWAVGGMADTMLSGLQGAGSEAATGLVEEGANQAAGELTLGSGANSILNTPAQAEAITNAAKVSTAATPGAAPNKLSIEGWKETAMGDRAWNASRGIVPGMIGESYVNQPKPYKPPKKEPTQREKGGAYYPTPRELIGAPEGYIGGVSPEHEYFSGPAGYTQRYAEGGRVESGFPRSNKGGMSNHAEIQPTQVASNNPTQGIGNLIQNRGFSSPFNRQNGGFTPPSFFSRGSVPGSSDGRMPVSSVPATRDWSSFFDQARPMPDRRHFDLTATPGSGMPNGNKGWPKNQQTQQPSSMSRGVITGIANLKNRMTPAGQQNSPMPFTMGPYRARYAEGGKVEPPKGGGGSFDVGGFLKNLWVSNSPLGAITNWEQFKENSPTYQLLSGGNILDALSRRTALGYYESEKAKKGEQEMEDDIDQRFGAKK